MAPQLSVALRNAMISARETAVGPSPIIEWREGAAPGVAFPATGALLATMTGPSDWLSTPSGGSGSKLGTWQVNASAAGTVGYCRMYNAASTVAKGEWEVGAVGSGKAMTVDNVNFSLSEQITVVTFVLTAGNLGGVLTGGLIEWSEDVINAYLDAIETTMGTSAVLMVREGTGPGIANPDSGAVLSLHQLTTDYFLAAVDGSKAKSGSWGAPVLVEGDAGHYRVYASDQTTQHIEGTISDADGDGDIKLSPGIHLLLNQVLNIATFTIYPYVIPPVRGEDLVLNGGFNLPSGENSYFNLESWYTSDGPPVQTGGPWYTRCGAHGAPYCEVQFDHDDAQSFSWDVGETNFIWQDMESDLQPHTQLYFYYGAIQHFIELSIFNIKIYGHGSTPPPADSGDWDALLLDLDQDDILAEVPKATSAFDYHFNEHVFSAPNYPVYRLELGGTYQTTSTGLKIVLPELRNQE